MGPPVRLLMLMGLRDEVRARLEAVDGRLELIDGGDAARLLMTPSAQLDASQQATLAAMRRELEQADVVCTGFLAPPGVPEAAPRLRWLHTLAAGVDRMHGTPIMASDVVITNSKGSNAAPVAEYAVWLMLSLAKLSRRLADAQTRHYWDRDAIPSEMLGKTVAIVGLGSIGEATAVRCHAFGMRVIATRRSVTRRQAGSGVVDEYFPPAELHAMLGQADYVVLAMPLTTETRGMIDAAAIAAMKPGACVINIARGAVLDDAALVAGLESGHLGGAGLDVFMPEPLPADSPYWDLANVIVTPHRSGLTHNTRAFDIFVENLERWLQNEPLKNVVDKRLGY